MASQGKKRLTISNREGIVARATRVVTQDVAEVAKKLMKSTGKAAWIAGTTFIVLGLPLIIEMDREQQLNDIELQQQTLLGAPPTGLPQ